MFLIFIRPKIFLIKLHYINKLNDYHPFLWIIRVKKMKNEEIVKIREQLKEYKNFELWSFAETLWTGSDFLGSYHRKSFKFLDLISLLP